MFSFSNILPFSDILFYQLMLGSIAVVVGAKFFLKDRLPLKYVIALISMAYLVLFFPKPLQFFGLLIYSYLVYILCSRIFKIQSLLLPIILFALPLIVMKGVNIMPEEPLENLAWLPLVFQVAGLSYVTFKVIQLYIDEREALVRVSPIDFFNFTAFLPTLLIGPIDRYRRFTTNIEEGYTQINGENIKIGIEFFLLGMLYKYIIAAALQQLVLNHLEVFGIYAKAVDMYTYLLYLFFDFAGYSLLAMSFGHFLGIQVPYNFDRPFLSENPKMFWQRWHKTLGDWLNDYFFKPMFKDFTMRGIFKPVQRQNLALFLTFSLMGFWNGFELHYVLSGMLFGLLSVVHNQYSYLCKKNKKDVLFGNMNPKFVRWISIFMMFNYVAFAIYVFSGKLI